MSSQKALTQPAQLNTKLANYLTYRPQEKAFLHLNKQVFAAGEDIWFKAYLTDAASLKPDDLSKVLYVDLTDVNDNLLDSRTLRVEDGMTHGDFKLNDSLPSGDYFLKAYTNYMLNFSPELLPVTPIKVVNAAIPETQKKPNFIASILDVKFLPESGQLVAGLVNNIGIKAVDSTGVGIHVSGVVFDSQGNEITTFKSEHAGIGNFKLIPKADEHYTARVYVDEIPIDFPFPSVKNEGAIIQVKSVPGKIELKVLAHEYSLENHYLIGYEKGMNVIELRPESGENHIHQAFSTENLPSGILYFTLFDGSNRPVAERLAFVNNTAQLPQLTITCPEKVDNREKIDIGLDLGQTKPTNLSMSVVSFRSAKNSTNNILTYLLLTSDLKGHIESPQFYFEEYNFRKAWLLDNLMMTQGWRRFRWQDALADTLPPVNNLLEQSMSIRGQLFKYENPNQPKQGSVSLTIMEDPLINGEVDTDEEGHFEFSGLEFQDTVTVVLQAKKIGKEKTKKGKAVRNDAYKIWVEDRYLPLLPDHSLGVQTNTNTEDETLDLLERIREIERMYGEKVILLDAVEIDAKDDEPANKVIDNNAGFYNNPSYRVILDSLQYDPRKGAGSVQDMLRAIQMPGFNPNTLSSRGANTINGSNNIVVYYMGQLLDISSIASGPPPGDINPQNIGAVDYFTGLRANQFGAFGAQGVLVLYPRKDGGYQPEVPGISNFKFPGYYQAREFYSPNYEVKKSEVPDYRSTLHWNPDIWLSKGKAEISFFTSDEDNVYLIDVQGITSSGEPITSQKIFTVE